MKKSFLTAIWFLLVRVRSDFHPTAMIYCLSLNCPEIGITKEFFKNKIPIYILDLSVFAAEKNEFSEKNCIF